MKKILFAIIAIAMLSFCKKNTNHVLEIEAVSPDIHVTILDPKAATGTLQQADATYSFLGFGYDVTDRLDDAQSVRAAIVNIPKLVAEKPGNFDLGKSAQGYWKNYTASDAEDFSSQMSNGLSETKGFKLFRNSFAAKFSGDDAFDKKYIYGYYSLISESMRLKSINNFNDDKYFTVSFAQDVKVFSPAELVKKYGTHLLQDIKLGAKLSIFYQAETNAADRKKVAATGLRYAVKKTFGLFTGELDQIDLYALNSNSSAKIYYEAIGGDISVLRKTLVNGGSFVDISSWTPTTTRENAKFISIAENGLIPLYDLILDAQKKAIVKDYITNYILANQAVTK